MFVYSPDIEGLVKWANSSDEIDFSDISALFGEKKWKFRNSRNFLIEKFCLEALRDFISGSQKILCRIFCLLRQIFR